MENDFFNSIGQNRFFGDLSSTSGLPPLSGPSLSHQALVACG